MIDSRDVSDDRDDSDDSDDDDERELGWCSDDDGTLGLNSCYIHLCLTPPPSPASPAAQHYLPQLAAQLYTATTWTLFTRYLHQCLRVSVSPCLK